MKIKHLLSLFGITVVMAGCHYFPVSDSGTKGETSSEVGRQMNPESDQGVRPAPGTQGGVHH